MATETQVAANRRNAGRSTGPRTAAGKAVANQNALSHGLTAEQIVLFDERAEDLARFRQELRQALDPADEMEEQLAERITLCAWRLRRAARLEAGLVNSEAEDIRDRGWRPKVGSAFKCAAFGLDLASRYEAALDRSLRRAYALLERRQARRRGEAVPAPIAVDIDGLEEGAVAIVAPAKPENYETKPISPPESPALPAAALSEGPAAQAAAAP
jgi:hypothetical protein